MKTLTHHLQYSAPLLLLAACYPSLADASEHLYGISSSYTETSSDFKQRSLNLSYEKNFFTATAHRSLLENEYDNYQLNAITAGVKALPVNGLLSVDAIIGQSQMKRDGGSDKDLTSYQLGAQTKWENGSYVNIQHKKDFVVEQQIINSADGKLLHAETTSADIEFRPAKRIRLKAQGQYQKLSDNNRSRKQQVGAYYGISPDWPWIWTGVEVEHLDYEREDAAYWTPQNHRSVAATLSASFPVNEQISLSSSASINRSKSDNNPDWGTGYYLSAGSEIQLNNSTRLSANAHRIKSQQDDSAWDETGAEIGLTFNHY